MSAFLYPKASAIRKREGLPALRSLQKKLFTSDDMTLLACSPTLCPAPSDRAPNIHTIGFVGTASTLNRTIPNKVATFMENGTPPVFITFGSCMQFKTADNMQLLIDAVKRSGHRALIQTGRSEPEQLHTDILTVGRINHSVLFPSCATIVHHGGAGTTQSALLARRTSIVVAHAYDQHD